MEEIKEEEGEGEQRKRIILCLLIRNITKDKELIPKMFNCDQEAVDMKLEEGQTSFQSFHVLVRSLLYWD